MSLSLKDFEIMAPVGSRESLAAAIQAGADSIYFGIENLNMRARSANTFTIDDLREIARTCDEHGMKSYLTVNTIIYDKDIPLMHTIVDAAKEAGISAVIAADVAVMDYARRIGQEVHLSTQLNISNAEALKFYARFADVVVLARELNLEQVAEIYRQIQEEHICGPSGEQLRIEMYDAVAADIAMLEANYNAQLAKYLYEATQELAGIQQSFAEMQLRHRQDMQKLRAQQAGRGSGNGKSGGQGGNGNGKGKSGSSGGGSYPEGSGKYYNYYCAYLSHLSAQNLDNVFFSNSSEWTAIREQMRQRLGNELYELIMNRFVPQGK